ncbi:MGMT family protein [Streptomyces bauhiniae]|uniref:Cysteine methyltransferase n=1 Tax=Streptomyces bauhiniae TaxID=2340725 RepID=A0A7K3QQ61_9ACTN|nr:cysteine methyltransferase [Streptomyces bauhiniae]
MNAGDAVREVAATIPRGRVVPYGAIGRRIGVGPRQVGRVRGLLGDGVPWWRVVRADGTPASCHEGRVPGLLRGEGVPMAGARVDLGRGRHRWAG